MVSAGAVSDGAAEACGRNRNRAAGLPGTIKILFHGLMRGTGPTQSEPAAMQQLALDGYDPVFGARPLKRLIQREVVDRIANEMVAGHIMEGAKVTVDMNWEGEYSARVENPQVLTATPVE